MTIEIIEPLERETAEDRAERLAYEAERREEERKLQEKRWALRGALERALDNQAKIARLEAESDLGVRAEYRRGGARMSRSASYAAVRRLYDEHDYVRRIWRLASDYHDDAPRPNRVSGVILFGVLFVAVAGIFAVALIGGGM